MKIAVDLSFIRPDHTNAGTESVIKDLIKGWIRNDRINDFIFFIHKDIHSLYKKLFPECKFKVYNLPGGHKIRTTIFQTWILPGWIKETEAQLLFYPTYTSGYYRRLHVPVIVNPHDIQFKFYPEYFSPLKKWYLDKGYAHSLKKADGIIAISDYVKATLETHYRRECGHKVRLLYEPVDFEMGDEVVYEPSSFPFILSASSILKHKNMFTLVKAFELIADKTPHQLIIVGCKGNGMKIINEHLKCSEVRSRILFTDYLEDAQYNWLFNHADLYVTTSLYEGFGRTPLEALARGVRTITSKETCLPEVTMGMAEYYEPSTDENKLAEKILEVLQMPVKESDPTALYDAYGITQVSNRYMQYFEEFGG